MRNVVTTFRDEKLPVDVKRSLEQQDPNRTSEHKMALAIIIWLRIHKTIGATFDELYRIIPRYLKLTRWDLGLGAGGAPRWRDVMHNIGKHQDASLNNACALGLLFWVKGGGYVLVDDDLTKEKYKWFVCLATRGEDLPQSVLRPTMDFEIIREVTTIIKRNVDGGVLLSYAMNSPILRKYPVLEVTRALARSSPHADGVVMSRDADPVLRIRERTKSRPVIPQPKLAFFD